MTRRVRTAVAFALALGGAALAQGAPTVTGSVEEVDERGGKLTIDHEPIPNLQMEAMSMVFRVQSPAMLKQVKAGDKVQFTADRVNGQITVTSIRKRP
jgi:Cu(I)/Ag(I) efflux system periplasmic protein CusF